MSGGRAPSSAKPGGIGWGAGGEVAETARDYPHVIPNLRLRFRAPSRPGDDVLRSHSGPIAQGIGWKSRNFNGYGTPVFSPFDSEVAASKLDVPKRPDCALAGRR